MISRLNMKCGKLPLVILLGCLTMVTYGCLKKMETKYENGTLKEQYFTKKGENGNFVKQGIAKKWYENGQQSYEGKWENGNLSHEICWNKNGNKIFEANATQDGFNGTLINYFENGKIKQTGTGIFNKQFEMINGVVTDWYEKGSKQKETKIINGLREGKSYTWYENGQLSIENNYKNDLVEGEVKLFYENGNLSKTYISEGGKINGLAKTYDSITQKQNGAIKYINNTPIIYYDANNEVVNVNKIPAKITETKTMTKEAFEKKFKWMSQIKVKGILGRPNHVQSPTVWCYDIDINDELSETHFKAVQISFYPGLGNSFLYFDDHCE